MMNETKADKSDAMSIEGYTIIFRKDRTKGGGGIAAFARDDIAPRCTVCTESDDERCWVMLHSDIGPVLACCWYRPPKPGEIASITRFRDEYVSLREEAIGAIIIGDMNVHCASWLKYSSQGNTPEGVHLRDTCHALGLKQMVREPTREQNLLDFNNHRHVWCRI